MRMTATPMVICQPTGKGSDGGSGVLGGDGLGVSEAMFWEG